eukprot:UN33331
MIKSVSVTDMEKMMIEALLVRYPENPEDYTNHTKQLEHFTQYAIKLGEIHDMHGENHDIATWYAESLMVLQYEGFNFFDKDGLPVGNTTKVISLLQDAMSNSKNPFAPHLYIHLIESSKVGKNGTDRGLPPSKTLEDMFYNSDGQHFQHMPAHIYLRTGLWYQIVNVSVAAIESDKRYIQNGLKP